MEAQEIKLPSVSGRKLLGSGDLNPGSSGSGVQDEKVLAERKLDSCPTSTWSWQ